MEAVALGGLVRGFRIFGPDYTMDPMQKLR
jgi:hypothetical protein